MPWDFLVKAGVPTEKKGHIAWLIADDIRKLRNYTATIIMNIGGAEKKIEIRTHPTFTDFLIGWDVININAFQMDIMAEGYVYCRLTGKKYKDQKRKAKTRIYKITDQDAPGKQIKVMAAQSILRPEEKLISIRTKEGTGSRSKHLFRLTEKTILAPETCHKVNVTCSSKKQTETELSVMAPAGLFYGKMCRSPALLATNKSEQMLLTNFSKESLVLRAGELVGVGIEVDDIMDYTCSRDLLTGDLRMEPSGFRKPKRGHVSSHKMLKSHYDENYNIRCIQDTFNTLFGSKKRAIPVYPETFCTEDEVCKRMVKEDGLDSYDYGEEQPTFHPIGDDPLQELPFGKDQLHKNKHTGDQIRGLRLLAL